MSYPPPPEQPGQGGFQYDPYGGQPGSQPPSPQGGGYSPQPPPQQPGYGPPQQPAYGQPQQPYGQPGMQPQMPPQYGGMPAPQPKNGLGTAGMVVGIIGIVLAWCGIVGIVLAVLAVSFGGVGVARANRGEATNKGMALTGVILGAITLALAILAWIWWGAVGLTASSTTM
ncbi:hypothetical protein GCM10027447_07370 [Glycomyces halotolerans]